MFPQSLQTAGLGGLSGTELMVVLAVAVLLFGGKKLGDVGKGLGEGIKNFKDAIKPEDNTPEKREEARREEARREEVRREEEIRK